MQIERCMQLQRKLLISPEYLLSKASIVESSLELYHPLGLFLFENTTNSSMIFRSICFDLVFGVSREIFVLVNVGTPVDPTIEEIL